MDPRAIPLNKAPLRSPSAYVLYWAQMNRRVDSNHALLHASELANRLRLPVLYYEELTYNYPYASDRLHTFVLEGVPETAKRLKKAGIGYVFYLRRNSSDPDDVLYQLARRAAAVITDDYPTAAVRCSNATAADRLDVPLIAVDASCIVPMRKFDKREWAAYTLRPKMRRLLPQFLKAAPEVHVVQQFQEPPPPFHAEVTPENIPALVAACAVDHSVPPSLTYSGRRAEAKRRLRRFLERRLARYSSLRNEPSAHATSTLSPYLHFGRLSSLEVALAVRQYSEEHKLVADEYLDELIVRRELAFNFTLHTPNCKSLESLPAWALATIRRHSSDPRSPVYTREEFEHAGTHDPLWNAAQGELLLRGTIHGYYRMYWGKKILEWSASPEEALETMIYLHDRYALDGRDPNTYTNILWCFGLHDRPWKERPVYGQVRYMSYEGMKRKTQVAAYVREIDLLRRTGRDPFR